MLPNRTMANHSFEMLANSTEFLTVILDNITSCVLLLDRDMKLQAFNNALKSIFSKKEDEDIMYMHCGEAIGCAHQVTEAKECGKTSQCCNCDLRLAAMHSYLNKEVVHKKYISRPFFNKNLQLEMKNLQFSTRHFYFQKERYIILILDDITDCIKNKPNHKEIKQN